MGIILLTFVRVGSGNKYGNNNIAFDTIPYTNAKFRKKSCKYKVDAENKVS